MSEALHCHLSSNVNKHVELPYYRPGQVLRALESWDSKNSEQMAHEGGKGCEP